jgi:hypothetical protein
MRSVDESGTGSAKVLSPEVLSGTIGGRTFFGPDSMDDETRLWIDDETRLWIEACRHHVDSLNRPLELARRVLAG